LVLAGAVAGALSAAAQSNTDAEARYFKDKSVRIVVGYGPGGGYDAYARMISPYLAKVLGASIVVENMPGAGGIIALNRTATLPPDGLTIQLVNGTGASLSQLLELPTVRYDIRRLGQLGTVSASPWMWMVGPGSAIKSPADAMKPGVKLAWAGSGPIDGLADGAAMTCEALRLDCTIVIGYKGSNDAALAVIRGEMDAIYVSDSTANNIARSGNARAVAAIGRKRSRFFASTPTIFEAANLHADAQWVIDFRSAAEDLGRILVAPPGMSEARLQFLRASIRAALADPDLLVEAERSQRYVGYLDAETTTRNVEAVLGRPTPAQKERIKAIVTKTHSR
jgi:tripartite-type tricarboxylate transporter receptor subunit TctC